MLNRHFQFYSCVKGPKNIGENLSEHSPFFENSTSAGWIKPKKRDGRL